MTSRRRLLAVLSLGALAGCLDRFKDPDAPSRTVRLSARVIENVSGDVTLISADDDRIVEVSLFDDLFDKLDDEKERGTSYTREHGEYELVSVRARADSDRGQAAKDAYDELPYSEPEHELSGVYIEYRDEVVAVELGVEETLED